MANRARGRGEAGQQVVKIGRRSKKIIKPVVFNDKKCFPCPFCQREFSSEIRVTRHLCEQRRRYQQRDSLFSRYGFDAYLSIQNKFFGKNGKTTEESFRKSDFYLACVRWGHFVIDINCLNYKKYLEWLLSLNIPIDKWNHEEIYDCWLQFFVFIEQPWEAFERSIKTMIQWQEETSKPYVTYFIEAGTARILTDIRKGYVTGWVIFNSKTGRSWLSNLEKSDLTLIWEWINPERWKIHLNKFQQESQEILDICTQTNL